MFHVAEEGSGGNDVLLECPCQLVDVSGWVSFISCDKCQHAYAEKTSNRYLKYRIFYINIYCQYIYPMFVANIFI